MTLPKSLSAYSDCREIFDKVVTANGGRLRLADSTTAVKLRARMNKFRQLSQQQAARNAEELGHSPSTPYDRFVISIEGSTLIFRPREVKRLEFTDLQGNPLEGKADPLLADALDFAVGLEDE